MQAGLAGARRRVTPFHKVLLVAAFTPDLACQSLCLGDDAKRAGDVATDNRDSANALAAPAEVAVIREVIRQQVPRVRAAKR